MQNFIYYAPTEVVFGKETENEVTYPINTYLARNISKILFDN